MSWSIMGVKSLNMVGDVIKTEFLRRAEGHFVTYAPRKFFRRVRRHFDIFSALLRVFN